MPAAIVVQLVCSEELDLAVKYELVALVMTFMDPNPEPLLRGFGVIQLRGMMLMYKMGTCG